MSSGDERERWTRERIREREIGMWELRCKGWTLARIAGHFKLSQSFCFKILRRIEERLLKRLTEKTDYIKQLQTEMLEHVADEALQAWERSKQPSRLRSKKTEKTVLGDGQVVPGGTEVEGQEARDQYGNPAYLEEARGAWADIRRIWGIDAPQKTELSGTVGGVIPITIVEVHNTSLTGPPATLVEVQPAPPRLP